MKLQRKKSKWKDWVKDMEKKDGKLFLLNMKQKWMSRKKQIVHLIKR